MRVEEQSTYFDDKALAAMIVAYDKTCSSILPALLNPVVREKIGMQIIEAATKGERDPAILHEQALRTLNADNTANSPAA